MNKTGSLSINSENIFPIIKKWLYSDHDIFVRELVSNGCDAITKLKKLGLSTVNNYHRINDSISNKECNNSCSCGNRSLCNSDLKDIKSLTGKDILKMIEEARFENFKNSIGANLTDEEKKNATNKVPNFYCGFIDDKEMEESIKQLLGKMAQK